MRQKYAPVLDEHLPLEEPAAEWLLPYVRTVARAQREADELGLRRLAESPEDVLRPRLRRLLQRGAR